MIFYKRYIGDYQRDTGHLSICEHGAYTLMMDAYYGAGKPLPSGKGRVFRLLRANTEEEQRAVSTVLDQFWELTADGWINPRAAKEIEKARKQAETNRRIAEEREFKRKRNESLDESYSLRSTKRQPIHSHSQIHSQSQSPDVRSSKNKKGQADHLELDNSRIVTSPGYEDPVLVEIPTNIEEVTYQVLKSKADEYKEAYPGIDVLQELREIRQWGIDNPDKRKTARGMPRHINSWMSRRSKEKQDGSPPEKSMLDRTHDPSLPL